MNVRYRKDFVDEFKKLSARQKLKIERVIEIFLQNPHHPTLRNHPLKGKWIKFRSISAEGDLRIHYQPIDDETVLFVVVGSHSQLYE